MWTLKNLIEHCNTCSTFINNRWIPNRPLNGTIKYASLKQRIKDAYAVFTCKAEAFIWTENQ